VRTLAPFEIAYTIAQTDIPTISDYDGVTALTSTYIQDSFRNEFVNMATVDFATATTVRTGEDFILNQPVQVFYATNVSFAGSSQALPALSDLETMLEMYFTTQGDAYLTMLQGLQGNIFSTTSAFNYQQNTNSIEGTGGDGGSDSGDSTQSTAAKTAGIAVAAGAGGFVVLVTALMLYRRKHVSEEDENLEKHVNDVHGDGHMTVAGETIAGTISVDSRPLHHRPNAVEREARMKPQLSRDDPWGAGYENFSTPQFRTSSSSGHSSLEGGHDSDGSDSSQESGSGSDGSNQSPKQMENVDL